MPVGIDVYEVVDCLKAASRFRMAWPRPIAVRQILLSVSAVAIVAVASAGAVSDLGLGGRWAAHLPFGTTSSDSRPVVAVMPLDELNGDPSQSYFADGLSEDLITELSRYPELAVVARNSTFALRGETANAEHIGRTLHARYVVEGSARLQGDRLRISAQLIDTDTGAHLWAKSYDRNV